MQNDILLANKMKKIGEGFLSQISTILLNYNFKYEPRSVFVLNALNEKETASIKEIAAILGMTHPAIVQTVNHLNMEGLLRQSKSSKDKRITLVELTESGKTELNKLEPILSAIKDAIKSIIIETDANLIYSLLKLDEAVKTKLLNTIVDEGLKQRAMKEIAIVPYKKKYKSDFARLNYEWLNKYFVVEKEDERVLKNPEREILKKSGEVFFAILNDEVVGTSAVLKKDDTTFEIVKMAVAEKARGKQVGKKLALTSIGYAVEKGAGRLTLSTSIKLTAALNLYRNLGFKEIEGETDYRYNRELIHMELKFIM
jgi:DNA-binding MarR family transcriptional regulator/GNAT superfamily N-acetyltransferase